MARIAVVTDSVGCIPRDIVQKYGIHVAPVHIVWGKDEEYRDDVDMTAQQFYTRLRKLGKNDKLPTTSSAIAGEFVPIFESLQGQVDGVVVVTLTGAIGASYNAALTAKDVVPNLPVEIVDTKSAMCAQGFVAVAAAAVAQKGAGIAEVKRAAVDLLPKIHLFWAMETLEYLRKGGRVSMPQAVLAGWLKVKPTMTISREGLVVPVARPRTMPKAIDKLMELMGERVTSTTLHAAVVHADVAEEAERLKKRVIERFHPVEVWVSTVTPVIGTHLGPGAIGLSFYNE